MPRNVTYRRAGPYYLRIQVCLAAALLLLIGMVQLWPVPPPDSDDAAAYRVSEREVIDIEEIQPTSQARRAPPPPSPPIPIVVPDDVQLDEHDLDFSESSLLEVEDPGEDVTASEGSDVISSRGGVTEGPKAVRFVEPEYTREARRSRVRAEVVVEVLVDDRGRVRETSIEERFLLDKSGESKTPVAQVGYGLEEAAVSAARRWIFRPARENGKPVPSYTTLTFTFGV